MKRINVILVVFVCISIAFVSCGKDKTEDRKKQLENRLSKIRFKVDSLMEYSLPMDRPGGSLSYQPMPRSQITDSTLENASVYLNSLVIGLVRTTFQMDDKEIKVEMAQFATANDAYGFYSQVRPSGVPLDSVGAESFVHNDTLRFTKADYVLTISTNADSNKIETIRDIARKIDSTLKTNSRPPQIFILFPYNHQIIPSQRFYSRNFLGIEGFDSVYTIDYAIDEDTLTLFMSFDTTGSKLVMLNDWGKDFGKVNSVPKEIVYPEDVAKSFTHPELGQFVVGMVNNKLAGVIGYNRPTGIKLVPNWIKGLQ